MTDMVLPPGGALAVTRTPGVLTTEHLDQLSDSERAATLADAFLASIDNPLTESAYRKDLYLWFAFCRLNRLDPIKTARPLHARLWYKWLQDPPPGLTWPRTDPEKDPRPVAAASIRTVARRASAVSAWYSYLVENDETERHPFAGIKRPKVDAKAAHGLALSVEQAAAMLDAAAADSDTRTNRLRNHAALAVLLGNALRGGELAGLRTGDITMWQGERVIRVTGKGNKQRMMPLHSQTLAAVDAWLSVRAGTFPGPLFTTNTGRPLDHKAVWRMVRRAAVLAHQLRPELGMATVAATITPHDTRRTFITVGLSEGYDINRVAQDAGHASTTTTEIYDKHVGAIERSTVLPIGDLIAAARMTNPNK